MFEDRGFRASALTILVACACVLPGPLAGQAPIEFRAHLSLLPVDAAGARQTSGVGEASATLVGRTLEIAGSYRELASPATKVELHQAAPALRGPAFHELPVSGDRAGTIEGQVDLSEAQAEALHMGHLYIQVYTETNPDGAIRGWFFPREDEQ